MLVFRLLNTAGCMRYIRQYEMKKVISINKFDFLRHYCISAKYDIKLKIQGKCLKNYINSLEEEFQTLSQNNAVTSNRWTELQPVIKLLQNRKHIIESIANLKEFFDGKDEELKKLAEDEKVQFEAKLKEIDDDLLMTLIPSDSDLNFDSLILEVQAGVGGQEAMLFAKEIFEMYSNFCNHKGWDLQISEYFKSEIGGIRSASAVITGTSVYQYFRHEAGIHRVQRVPTTEKGGRVHTSTISVAVLPQPSEVQVNINSHDLKIETKRSSGAGGQHVNKTESAIRIIHLPTGIAVECQEDRSQIKNRKLALTKLRAILYQRQLNAQCAQTTEQRKKQVKSRNRNEKIRTYNFKDDRITDHRLRINVYNLNDFLEGTGLLAKLIEQLEDQHRLNNLLDTIENTS